MGRPLNCRKCNKSKSVCKCGRPSVMTDEVVSKLEEAFKIDCSISEACAYAGISRQAYYENLERNSELSDKMHRAQEYPTLLAKKLLFRAMDIEYAQDRPDIKPAIEYLKRRDRGYSDKQESEVSGDISIKIFDDDDTEQEFTTQ